MAIGVVIVNYNCSANLEICLDSILRATCEAEFCAVVVDNGSEKEDEVTARTLFESFAATHPHKYNEYIAVKENLGYAGGNNVAIKRLLAYQDISHICLLNADTVVTESWLDVLLECNADLAGPVSNAGGGLQTVFCDRDIVMDNDAFITVSEIAKRRKSLFSGFKTETDMITFFAVLIARRVFEKIGLLDERFFPGTFEDDDFCVRAVQNGNSIVIARDCYLHHWGGGSFQQLHNLDNVFIENLERFEKKWNIKHADREWKIYRSAAMDFKYLQEKNETDSLIAAQIIQALTYAENDREFLIQHYDKLLEQSRIGNYNEIPFLEMPKQIIKKIKRKFKR